MENEKISVIIPAYNIENEISRCLNSILKQTYENIEIIVVDDGSTDRTLEILNQYEERNDNIVVVHQENQGVFSAITLSNKTKMAIMSVCFDESITPERRGRNNETNRDRRCLCRQRPVRREGSHRLRLGAHGARHEDLWLYRAQRRQLLQKSADRV